MILRKKLLKKEEKDEKACIVDRSFIRLNKYPNRLKTNPQLQQFFTVAKLTSSTQLIKPNFLVKPTAHPGSTSVFQETYPYDTQFTVCNLLE